MEKEATMPSSDRNIRGGYVAGIVAAVGMTVVVSAQGARQYALETVAGLRLENVVVTPATLSGKKGVQVRTSDAWRQKIQAMTPAERDAATRSSGTGEQLAIIDGTDFADGVIEAEIAGSIEPGVFEGARGFVGIAFRVQKDLRTYDAFYLRPTNGRADDQLRRNHSAQHISHPDWTWSRLRTESPGVYESYVDLVPGEWTKIRIEVRGDKARLFVHGQPQPTLIVNDLKTGAAGRGAIALWIDVSTVAHFRNVVVTPE